MAILTLPLKQAAMRWGAQGASSGTNHMNSVAFPGSLLTAVNTPNVMEFRAPLMS
jgi:hypothetical protein